MPQYEEHQIFRDGVATQVRQAWHADIQARAVREPNLFHDERVRKSGIGQRNDSFIGQDFRLEAGIRVIGHRYGCIGGKCTCDSERKEKSGGSEQSFSGQFHPLRQSLRDLSGQYGGFNSQKILMARPDSTCRHEL